MTMIFCPECHELISENATTCPKCGNPINLEEIDWQNQDEIRNSKTNRELIRNVLLFIISISITGYLFLADREIPLPDASQQAQNVGREIIVYADKYLDGKITALQALEGIIANKEEFEQLAGSRRKKDVLVYTYIQELEKALIRSFSYSSNIAQEEVRKARNNLAEVIGKKY